MRVLCRLLIHMDYVDRPSFFETSQPEFLPTQVGKLWKAMNANQKQIATVCYNIQKYSNIVFILLKTKQLLMGGILFSSRFTENVEFG